MVEPWLRGTLSDVDTVRRGVLHALELAREDVERWCSELTDAELEVRPFALPSVGFQMRHMARSLDRLLTYAEARQLSPDQLNALKHEQEPGGSREALFAEFEAGIASAMQRIRAIDPASLGVPRGVGRATLPSSVGGLLVHCADHTQRHAGQLVTTAKVVLAMRGGS